MKYTADKMAELNLLLQFDIRSAATGIKVHQDATDEIQAAVGRLLIRGYAHNQMEVISLTKALRLRNMQIKYSEYSPAKSPSSLSHVIISIGWLAQPMNNRLDINLF